MLNSQSMLANSYSSISSLISMSLIGFCCNLTQVINPVVRKRGKGRSWGGSLLPWKKKQTSESSHQGTMLSLNGRSGPPLRFWGLNGIWRAKIFGSFNLDVFVWCVRVPSLPTWNLGFGITDLLFIFNHLSSLATRLNPEFSLQLDLLPHCRK